MSRTKDKDIKNTKSSSISNNSNNLNLFQPILTKLKLPNKIVNTKMKNKLRGLDLSIGIRNSKRILQFGEAR
jgi:replication initiation and membrane attachment protein DnaB